MTGLSHWAITPSYPVFRLLRTAIAEASRFAEVRQMLSVAIYSVVVLLLMLAWA
jgi:hypothetical protein